MRHVGHQAACSSSRSDPESKGVVERRNGFFETSFMPGRTFESPADFNAQFTDWLASGERRGWCARSRPARSTCRRRPGRDAGAAADPARIWVGATRSGWVATTTSASTPTTTPSTRPLIGRYRRRHRRPGRVQVRLDGRLVADHARVWARGMTITDPAHVADRRGCCASSSSSPVRRAAGDDRWCGTWPTTTAPSGSTTPAGSA